MKKSVINLLVAGAAFFLLAPALYLGYQEKQERTASATLTEIDAEHFSKGEYREAIDCYDKLVAAYPRTKASKTAYYRAGQCHHSLGEHREAINKFKQAAYDLKSQKNEMVRLLEVQRNFFIGKAYEELENYSEALSYYELAQKASEHPAYLHAIANVCKKLGGEHIQKARAATEEIFRKYAESYDDIGAVEALKIALEKEEPQGN